MPTLVLPPVLAIIICFSDVVAALFVKNTFGEVRMAVAAVTLLLKVAAPVDTIFKCTVFPLSADNDKPDTPDSAA